ncbi:hypothetical protein ABW21_db0204278 [Orbilia brochopaga]|nr:hypothetical protein ABW21_db0204278 [Drechslerella brochopaga]
MTGRRSKGDREPKKPRPPKYGPQRGMAPGRASGWGGSGGTAVADGDCELPAFFVPAATPAAAARTNGVDNCSPRGRTSVHLLPTSPTISVSTINSSSSTSSSVLPSSLSSSSNTIVLNPAAPPFYPPPPYQVTESTPARFREVPTGILIEISDTPPETPPQSPELMRSPVKVKDSEILAARLLDKISGPKPEWVKVQLAAAASSKKMDAASPSHDRPAEQQTRQGSDLPRQQRKPIVTLSEPWRRLPEVSVKLFRLPSDTTTYDLWVAFKDFGSAIIKTVDEIEIFENKNGNAQGTATLRFCDR